VDIPRVTSVVDARQLVQVLLGFGVMGEAHMQQRMVADVPALTGAMDEGMEEHRSIMVLFWLLSSPPLSHSYDAPPIAS
jgi:hypothetical protein